MLGPVLWLSLFSFCLYKAFPILGKSDTGLEIFTLLNTVQFLYLMIGVDDVTREV
jgi:hypothetical protein